MHRNYIPQLDGLRALAIFLVLLAHSSTDLSGAGSLGTIGDYGSLGVQLFFVLSGYLITGILLAERDQEGYFKNFFCRRGLRIWPLYYVVLASVFLFGGANKHPVNWIFFALYISNLVYGRYHPRPGALGPMWSLAVEEQFYLIWPFLVWKLSTKYLERMLLFVVITIPFLRLALSLDPWNTIGQLDALGLGALIACRNTQLPKFRKFALVGVTFIPLGMLAAQLGSLDATIPKTLYVYGCGALLMLTLENASMISRLLRNRMLIYVGRISYGIYLLHIIVFWTLKKSAIYRIIDAKHSLFYDLLFVGIEFAATIAVASLSFHFFESPILRFKRHFVTRHVGNSKERSLVASLRS